jgi:hypothetical protein
MKDEGFEYLMSVLPAGPDKSCALNLLPRALDFVRERDSEFGTAQMQKHLKTGYGKTVKILDALVALCVIEVVKEKPIKYKRLAYKGLIEHDIFYNVTVREADDEYDTAWDPSLFRTVTDAMKYAKEAYGGSFRNPIYIIEKVRVGNGWEIIGRDEIKGYEEKAKD